MNSLRDFFSTDWEAMTRADISGLVIVVILTVLMVGLYMWVFNPKNRDEFEQHRDFVNDIDDDIKREIEHGQTK